MFIILNSYIILRTALLLVL